MGNNIVATINGRKYVRAHAHEKGAIEHAGDFWRPADPEPCHWCGSLAGTSPGFDGYDRCNECQGN